MKPGWKTTEWWGKNLVQIISLAAMAYAMRTGHDVPPETQAEILKFGLTIIGGVETAYGIGRSYAKNKQLSEPTLPNAPATTDLPKP